MGYIAHLPVRKHEVIIEYRFGFKTQVLERANDGGLIAGNLGFDQEKVMPFSQLNQTLQQATANPAMTEILG